MLEVTSPSAELVRVSTNNTCFLSRSSITTLEQQIQHLVYGLLSVKSVYHYYFIYVLCLHISFYLHILIIYIINLTLFYIIFIYLLIKYKT